VNRLFAGIRWRLVAWTMLVLVLILALAGTAVYLAVARSLIDQVDRTLLTSSDQAAATLAGVRAGARLEGPPGYRGGVFFLVVDPDGQIVANPQQVSVSVSELPPAGRPPSGPGAGPPPGPGGGPPFATVTVNGQPTRVLGRSLPNGSILYVGQSLVAENNALRLLLLVLLAGAGFALVLSFGGAWFLSGRALIPIQQAFRRQQEFVADASHELRTPLTVLRSATELLNRHRDEPLASNGALFDDIRAEIARMERLAADLLTLARSDQGELELMVAPLDLASLTGDVMRRVAPLAQAQDVALALETDGPPATVEADPDRLQQVLLILLDNAIKHTPAGGRVAVAVHRQGAAAVLEVSDTGAGIAPEDLPRIFDRFYRADTARSHARGGTGLGLAIAKTLVDAHHGALTLTSTPGVGTRASVRLPLLGDHPSSLGGRIGELASHFAHAHARD
jgi:two-component system, OmpR family, sensor histidine kinase CiaH